VAILKNCAPEFRVRLFGRLRGVPQLDEA